jgi:acyl transferase domain-containing protein/NAD(P)H-dependent flavin oxidoreductase YrpB (nitropropane dioxygenase family)/NAD(P)-dependent dehydrogenase (short-subunit alcohol dehydrogenase family)
MGAAGVVLDDQLWLMRESPLSDPQKTLLANCTGQEAMVVGESLGMACRVLVRPELTGGRTLQQLAQEIETQIDETINVQSSQSSGTALRSQWYSQAIPKIGWGHHTAWPMGQAIALAKPLADRYKTVGRLIQALLQTSQAQVEAARTNPPLGLRSPLAQAHRTPYPIVQGPMTRVSDTAAFAEAVAQGGALPLLALAMMRAPQVEALLQETQARIGSKSWGVGILGFVPAELRAEQLAVVHRVKPPFALIAGGRPDQAAQLEAIGIATYLHVPTPKLLRQFLAQGARRFVFEGRECGGHIGPLSSFVLWETMVETLLEEVSPPSSKQVSASKRTSANPPADQVQILFAGGIHDARSSAMINAMVVPLAERGIRCGVLMGTAYLFTQEAVTCGAVVPEFQAAAQRCDRTVNLELGPGHAIRCTQSPFTNEFMAARQQLVRSGLKGAQLHDALEKLTVGRLRVASKGLERDDQGQLGTLDQAQQWQRGMYMMGQVATLRHQVCSIAQLHQEICPVGSAEPTPESNPIPEPEPSEPSAVPIAIIGMSSILPGSQNPQEFWQNILNQVNAITEVPADQWDWQLYYDADPKAPDKMYSKWGGFINDVAFDPVAFGIPPKAMTSIAPAQLLALAAAQQALEDAGYGDGDYDRENTAVIFANADGGGGTFGNLFITRTTLSLCLDGREGSPESANGSSTNGSSTNGSSANGSGANDSSTHPTLWHRLPEWTESTYPGTLDNVVAGRIANRLDVGGKNFTVDSACASSLSAIDVAVQELASGNSNLVIAGAVDTTQSPYAFIAFSKTHALSPKGQPRTFDQAADGIAIGEGTGVVILKRLADAERDGDRIYGVLRSVAGSSDGKALGLTAPRPQGQMRALHRAYGRSGINPNTLGLVEAHGTGTAVGDRAELETVTTVLQNHQAPAKSCALGSVKTLIGHTKATAGIAGLIKSTLALHHQVLPPHWGVENPLAPISDPKTPVFLLKQPRPWLAHPDYPRRAGVSAFGFGGTNAHAVLEEYQGDLSQPVMGSEIWPYELLVFRAESREALAQSLTQLYQALGNGARPSLRDLAYTYAHQAQQRRHYPVCLCLVVPDDLSHQPTLGRQPVTHTPSHLEQYLQIALKFLQAPNNPDHALPVQMLFSDQATEQPQPIAFLFPGQGSQYPNMAREMALYFPEMRRALEATDRTLQSHFPNLLSHLIYPPAAYTEAEEQAQKQRLAQTRVAQPAIGTISLGFLDLATRLGLEPTMVAGHSYGECTALHCGGVLDHQDFLEFSALRGRLIAEHQTGEGAMAAVWASREQVENLCQTFPDLVLANHNGPQQSVIAGKRTTVQAAVDRLESQGTKAKLLNVSAAFHSPMMAPVTPKLWEALSTIPIHKPTLPIYANHTTQPYESEAGLIRQQIAHLLEDQVRFCEQIEQMYAAGARVFIELGPKSVLTRLVDQILEDRSASYSSISFDGGRGLRGFLWGLGTLITEGVPLDLLALFQGRSVQQLKLSRLAQTTAQSPLSPTTWLVSGTYARPHTKATGYPGQLPFLTDATRQKTYPVAPAASVTPSPATQRSSSAPSSPAPLSRPSGGRPSSSAQPGLPVVSPNSASPSKSVPMPNPMPSPQPIIAQSSPLTPGVPKAPGPNASAALQAYGMYQETMRQFLGVQERVMAQFLSSGNAHQPSLSQSPVPTPAPPTQPPVIPAAPTPSLQNGSHTHPEHNGNQNGHNGYPALPQVAAVPASPVASSLTPPGVPLTTSAPVAPGVPNKGAEPQVPEPNVNQDQTITPETSEATATLDSASLTQLWVDIISESTGYPGEMLGLDLDLEADLGIDSIKRTEIFGAFRQQLPTDMAQQLSDKMEQLSAIKSINGLVEAILGLTSETPDSHPKTSPQTLDSPKTPNPNPLPSFSAEQAISQVSTNRIPCPRFTLQGQFQPLSSAPPQLPPGLILVTADAEASPSATIAQQVLTRLKHQGATTAVLDRTLLQDPQALGQQLATLRDQHQTIGGILHLAPLVCAPTIKTLEHWRNQAQTQVKGLFSLLQLCAQDFGAQDGADNGSRDGSPVTPTPVILTASLLGGCFGRDGQGPLGVSLSGGCQGLVKTIHNEWSGLRTRVLDFDPGHGDEFIAAAIVAEFLHPDRQTLEVAYPLAGRTIFSVIAANHPIQSAGPIPISDRPRPSQDWVMLATGGAQGITAEIIRSLAVPGMTLILVGRSPEPTPESPSTAGITDRSALRQALINHWQTPASTPAQVEAALRRLLRQRAMVENLQALRQMGLTVEYHGLDVRDADTFVPLLNQIYQRYGHLDAVFHGAGVIEDKLIVQKSRESFDRVFDTKVDSAFLLRQHLKPETLKLMVLFSSVAALIGNRGQGDYAAANEVLNRMAWEMDQAWPQTQVLAINWGPWQDAGMASAQVNQQFLERGIVPIETQLGCDFVWNEINRGQDTEVIAGAGPWGGTSSEPKTMAPV